jgi:hypothetical protein
VARRDDLEVDAELVHHAGMRREKRCVAFEDELSSGCE